jgi:hypothetical protein
MPPKSGRGRGQKGKRGRRGRGAGATTAAQAIPTSLGNVPQAEAPRVPALTDVAKEGAAVEPEPEPEPEP